MRGRGRSQGKIRLMSIHESGRARRCSSLAAAVVALVAASPPAWGQPDPTAGPAIDLAPEHKEPAARPAVSVGAGTASEPELVRGMTDQRFRSAEASSSNTSIGGYGEVHVKGTT